jgi:hypothetical protein
MLESMIVVDINYSDIPNSHSYTGTILSNTGII